MKWKRSTLLCESLYTEVQDSWVQSPSFLHLVYLISLWPSPTQDCALLPIHAFKHWSLSYPICLQQQHGGGSLICNLLEQAKAGWGEKRRLGRVKEWQAGASGSGGGTNLKSSFSSFTPLSPWWEQLLRQSFAYCAKKATGDKPLRATAFNPDFLKRA